MISLDELRELYLKYQNGLSDWSQVKGDGLDEVIKAARTPTGGHALEVLVWVPSASFSSTQLDELFHSLIFWLQGPSKFYESSLRALKKHSGKLAFHLERGFSEACEQEDDSLVRGYCHLFSLLDTELQNSLKAVVRKAVQTSNDHVKEAILDLAERSSVFLAEIR
jgi:hypothetical protein